MHVFGRSKSKQPHAEDSSSNKEINAERSGYSKAPPTGLRVFTITIYTLATVFLILVLIGNINNNAVIRSTYFLRIELANIIPASVPYAVFINSIAQSIGLHDFYQVGLWNFCEGYNGQGITHCSPTETLYWFNPVEIILNELLAGASIKLPSDVVDVLELVRLASAWMFACFIVGVCLTFLCVFFAPMGFSKHPRWQHRTRRIFLRQLPITILSFGALLLTAAASVIATVMFVIFRNQFQGAADLNIHARLGQPMFAFMWIATGLNLVGFLMQVGTCCGVCCCTGRRKAERRSQRQNHLDVDGSGREGGAGGEEEKAGQHTGTSSSTTGKTRQYSSMRSSTTGTRTPTPGRFASQFRKR
ncbi:hypothetical protein G647_01350 [Cladophialophora carrionii CBS 160.54]|uniref:Integral membrane protein n=1 Tax=Cladophialophora carrionii CBS 160.54 TaxID=1279043 RepID=V9DRH8_9EURO|nr:uncharacterized protein G647_01350 [Cladophialophora carrionii CBS 160.54]ETI28898.1 hypothetical protein G647_01350 [Cladophialophora carrionii CBS 160.54]